jgi:hypothetical protein
MLAKIDATEKQRITTKVSLFRRKTINQITCAPYFCPTIFNLENIAFVRLVCHDRSLSDAFAQCGICLCSCISAKRLTVCVSRWWAGVDSAGEQEKARSQKNA